MQASYLHGVGIKRHSRRRILIGALWVAATFVLTVSVLSPPSAGAEEPAPTTDGAQETAPAQGTAAVQGKVHIHDLNPAAKELANGRWRARINIKVRDAGEKPVAGAVVRGVFGKAMERSCTTDAKGYCYVTRTFAPKYAKARFKVTGISAPKGYAPRANHDPGCDSDGTTTVAHRPEVKNLVIDRDTTYTSELLLRPGDTIRFKNGARLNFAHGGCADWQGTPTSTWSKDGAVQNLKRDVKILGQGDIRFEHGSRQSTIRYVEINLQPKVEEGRYPLHWHHAMDGSRGTIVKGVVVKNSTNRAYVPHASHGIRFRDNIAKNTTLAGFWWDPPCACDGVAYPRFHTANNSNDTSVVRMLVDGVKPPNGSSGHTLSAFVLGAGSGNTIRDSVAMNVDGGKNSSGFSWPSQANQNEGGNVWVAENLRAHHVVDGIFVWQNDSNLHVIRGFKAWAVSDAGIEHGAYTNKYKYVDPDIDKMIVHALGDWRTVRGRIDEVRVQRHQGEGKATFNGTDIERVVIANGSGTKPGTFFFNNTGLSCNDVVVEKMAPGTTVTINGNRCTL